MIQQTINRILKNLQIPNLLERLTEHISGSELQSLLLAVFERIPSRLTPAALLRHTRENRFVQPSLLDPLELLQYEHTILTIARNYGCKPIQLSPLAPLGSCSIIAPVHQNKVVSALRGTEIVADATNMLALLLCKEQWQKPDLSGEIRHTCCTHRHVRAQQFTFTGFTPHFQVFCMVSAGRDTGSLNFERLAFQKHLELYRAFFSQYPELSPLRLQFYQRSESEKAERIIKNLHLITEQYWQSLEIMDIIKTDDNAYYDGVQWKLFIANQGKTFDIADGGLVNWSQRLLENHKERMMISGLGLELLIKIVGGTVKNTNFD